MQRLAIALIWTAVLPACGSEKAVDHKPDSPVDVAAQADRKAREDAASALEQRSGELRVKDRAQSKDLAEQARAMRDHDKAIAVH